MEIIVSSAVVLFLILIGMAVSFSFLAGALLYLIITGTSMGSVVTDAFFALDSFALLAVPLFMIAGSLMEVSGIAERLIEFSRVLLKRFKGGMGAIIPVSSMFFGALSGSGTATVAALSNILIPKMVKLGWDRRYIAALLAASGPLGFMIPPNMSAILYGVIANSSIAALFLATVIPGIIWGILYIIINRVIYTKWYREPEDISSDLTAASIAASQIAATTNASYYRELLTTFNLAIPAFIMPVLIFGGIYGGIFTATEAGAVACIYAIFAGVFIFKKVGFKNGFGSFVETGEMLGAILIILPMVIVFTRLLVVNNVPQMVAEGMNSISSNPNIILLMIITIFVIAGFFLDPGVLIFVITPVLIPSALSIDLDLIQLGVILFVSIGIGTVTPPMAMNLFVASKASGVPIHAMIKPLVPFVVFGALPVLLLVTYVPELSLWLPRVIMGLD